MIAFLSGIWVKLAAAAAVVVAILSVALTLFVKGEGAGKAKIQAADARITNDAVSKAHDVQVAQQAKSESQVDAELESKWTRKS